MLWRQKLLVSNHFAGQRKKIGVVGLLQILAFCALSAGCSGRNPAPGDPLLGPEFRKGTEPVNRGVTQTNSSNADTEPIHQLSTNAVPPVPVYRNTSSTAAIAAGMSLPGSRPLAIPTTQGQSSRTNSKSQNAQPVHSPWIVPPPGSQEKPILKQPIVVPVPHSKAPGKVDDKVVQASAVSQQKSEPTKSQSGEEELLQQLQQRGVIVLRRETISGSVRLVCGLPHSRHPNNLHIFEVTAPTIREAMTAILNRLDNMKQ